MTTKRARLAAVPPAAESDSAGITRMIGLAELAGHPENPRGADVGDVSELAASIGSHGLLEPLVVVSAEAFTAAHEHLQLAADAGVAFVVVAGHRRLAAAQLAALTEVPAVVRDDLAAGGRDIEVMVAENLHREDLTAMQEARAFAQLRTMGHSQRQIAAAIGCGQSHVSKRLALLDLPEAGQKAIAAGQITPSAAEELLKLRNHPDVLQKLVDGIVEDLPEPSDDPEGQDVNGAVGADDVAWEVQDALRQIQIEEQIETNRATLAEQGIPSVELADLRKQLGPSNLWDQEIHPEDTERFEAEKASGTLVANITPAGGVNYYSTTPFTSNKKHPISDHRAKEAEEAKQRAAAMKARAAACGRLVKTVPAKDALISVLSGAVLARHVDAACLDMAYRWLTEHGIGAQLPTQDDERYPATEHYAFERAVQASGDVKLQAHLAYAMAIASQENRTRANWRPWNQADVDYLQLLADKTGYQPTAWEQARLAAAGQQHGDDEAEDLVEDEEVE